jgi:hypothetical protein
MFFVLLFGLPALYLVVLVALLLRREWRGVGPSFLFVAAAVLTAIWAIDQSRSSTASLGYFAIPPLGALAGFLGLAFGRYRSSASPARRLEAWLGFVAALGLIAFNIYGGVQSISKNRSRDDQQAVREAEIARNRQMITTGLAQNPGRQRAWLDSSIRARINDQTFLYAALPNDSVSPELLDTLASSSDMGIALEAVRNPGTRGETLARVYRTKSYPDYFFQALAGHRHTPPDILRDLYHRQSTIGGLDIWFAGNPATPREILAEIARTSTDGNVINALLGNPSLDCGLLSSLAVNLMKIQKRDADNPNVMRLTQLEPTLCPGKTKP